MPIRCWFFLTRCEKLHENGANIWYDEGIKAAGEWVEEIAYAIKNSSLFLVFISPRAVDSRYVKSEVGYASGVKTRRF